MITAVVRYKLPPQIDYAACREHFHKIAPDFREVTGLISKHFIWTESGWAGGVYQWNRIEDAKAFYTGPWLEGIIQRYGMKPQIDFYEVFAVTDNTCGRVELFKEIAASKSLREDLAHLPRWGVEVAVALEDGTQSPSRRHRQRLDAVTF